MNHLDYTLAKQLHDVGFSERYSDSKSPHLSVDPYYRIQWAIEGDGDYMGGGEPHYRVPLLGELIKACGDGFVALVKNHEYDYQTDQFIIKAGYKAGKPSGWDDGSTWINENYPFGEGNSREEAVARLYLALHDSNTG